MIPVKAHNDFEKSIDWGMMLAEKLDLSQYDNGRMKRLCKGIDNFIEQEQIDACSVKHQLCQNKKEKRMMEKQRLAARMQRMSDDDHRLLDTSSEDEDMNPTRSRIEKTVATPNTRSSRVEKDGRDDVFQAVVGLKVMKGEGVKGCVTNGFHLYLGR